MSRSRWIDAPQRLRVVSLAVMLTIAATLGWLGWHLLQQERKLSRDSIGTRLNIAAEAATAVIGRKLSEIETSLTAEPPGGQHEHLVIVTFTPDGIDTRPPGALSYYPYPFVPASLAGSPPVFHAGERVELVEERYAQAAEMFLELARSRDPAMRAGALMRAAGALRKAGAIDAALATYGDLARMGPVPLEGGLYADLVALEATVDIRLASGQRAACQHEASSLYDELTGGRWRLHIGQWDSHRRAIRPCLPDAGAGERQKEVVTRAAAVDWLWWEWEKVRSGGGRATGREALWIDGRSTVIVWRSSPQRLVAAVGGAGLIKDDWGAALQQQIGTDFRFSLTDTEGHLVLGEAAAGELPPASRSLADAQVRWTLHAEIANPGAELASLERRQRWFLVGLGLAGALILTGGFVIARTVARELEVARLQSDFVSAVSHDFRTPLATLRQASELLADGRVSSDERRQGYYEALRSETERLQRLVEDLLDFRRMDAGVQPYTLEAVPVGALVRDAASEFSGTLADHDWRIDTTGVDSPLCVRADRRAIVRVLRNLLDNAVKYSPQAKTICIDVRLEGQEVAISVRDQGMGIEPKDQKRIFNTFVRAGGTKIAGIKGTGLGLAIARHILSAHGGRITVASQPGAGSTFTILLPVSRHPSGAPMERQLTT